MLSIEEIIDATGGTVHGIQDLSIIPEGFSTDSRTVRQGELFVALKGPNFDGHRFAGEAINKGAVAVVVSRDVGVLPNIQVPDTLKALGDAALYYRNKLDLEMVLITGTNGKTTVKNILKALLETNYKTYASPASYNNLIGLPLSVLEITPEHRIAALEAGISEKGEMERLCAIARPTQGIITNISAGHLEGLGSLNEVLDAKWNLARYLEKKNGTLYVNADYPQLLEKAAEEGISPRTFGLGKRAQAKPEDIAYEPQKTRFIFRGQGFQLPLPGEGNLSNTVAALTVAVDSFEIQLVQAAQVLEGIGPERWRLEYRRVGDVGLVVDCYNANPASMRQALEILTLYPSPRIALLGAMLELGERSRDCHHQVLKLARDKADLVIITGLYCELYPEEEGVLFIRDKDKAIQELRKRMVPGSTVLIKASRGCAFEEIVARLWGST